MATYKEYKEAVKDLHMVTFNVLFYWHQKHELKAGSFELLQFLSRDTGWAKVLKTGPESMLKQGDEILVSKRVDTIDIKHKGLVMHNTSDRSILGFKRHGKLGATYKTFLYELLTLPDLKTESGIILATSTETQEQQPVWGLVHAAGEETELKPGDRVLIAYNPTCYVIDVEVDQPDGTKKKLELRNGGKEEIIFYERVTKEELAQLELVE